MSVRGAIFFFVIDQFGLINRKLVGKLILQEKLWCKNAPGWKKSTIWPHICPWNRRNLQPWMENTSRELIGVSGITNRCLHTYVVTRVQARGCRPSHTITSAAHTRRYSSRGRCVLLYVVSWVCMYSLVDWRATCFVCFSAIECIQFYFTMRVSPCAV